MNKKQTIVISALTLLVIILALLVSARIWVRADLSKTKAYTISKVSRGLADEIPEQVEITYFVSGKLRQLYPAPGEIEDLISEYAAYSRGKIRFKALDPVKAGMEDRMQELGIPAQQMQVVEGNEAAFSMVYSGLLIEYLDRYDVLPVVFSIDTLEYDITSRVRTLVRESDRRLGILVAESGKTLDNDYGNLVRYLGMAGYKLRPFNPGEEIPDGFPLLMVIGGTETLEDWDLYRIDRYIQQGGKVLFAAASVVPELSSDLSARKLKDAGLLSMLASYGVEVKDALLLDPSSITTTFNSAGPGGTQVTRLIRYPFWVNVLPQFANASHPVCSGFNGVDLFWPNPLELKPLSGIEGIPLFSSTPEAWLQTENYTINPDMAYLFSGEKENTRGIYPLGAALSGKQSSYFRGKPKPEREGAVDELPDLPAASEESRIIVVGNTEFAGNAFNQNSKNYSFLIAACDWLSNDDDIIRIRSRAPQAGRLDKIVDQEKRLGAFAFAKVLNTVFIPLAVLVLAFVFAKRRKANTARTKQEEK